VASFLAHETGQTLAAAGAEEANELAKIYQLFYEVIDDIGVRLALKSYKQPATLRFEVLLAARFWVAAAITWCCTCPKTGVAIRNESRSSPASYIGLRQLL
jgi:hypothetical protein